MQQGLSNQAGFRAAPRAGHRVRERAATEPALAGPRLAHRSLLLLGASGPARLETALMRRVLDRLLAPAAQVEGVDLHLSDAPLADCAAQALGYVLVMPPLGNLSNSFYQVHPRRNDRFLTAHPPLKALFPEVDFAPIAFTGHALGTLAACCPERFALVRQALVQAWVLRMRYLLDLLPVRGVLIDLPTPAWLPRPSIPGEGRRRLVLDPDDRASGALALRAAIQTWNL